MPRLISPSLQSWKSAKALGLLAVLALAIGIGSATAIFTVINALLLRPVPFALGERFVSVLGASFDDPGGMSALSLHDVLQYQQQTRSFDVFGWFIFNDYNLTAPGEPQHLNGVKVTPALVNGLGVHPLLGSWFRDATEPAAVLSYSLWKRLGGEPTLLGKPVTLNGRAFTISGVMAQGFNLPLAGPYSEAQVDLWVPLDPLGREQDPNRGDVFCYARLRPGVTVTQASAEVKRIAADIAKREPASHPGYTARVDDLQQLISKDVRPILLLLLGAAGLLLLVTCANVGGLLVARSVARARETAVRVALGANLRQLAVQYSLESLFVAIPGALAGLLLCATIVRVLVDLGGAQSARINAISMDWRVIVFTFATAFFSAVIASMAPLWQAARVLPNDVLNEGIRSSAGTSSQRLARGLVVGEIALAFVLLSLGAVLVAELYRLTRVSPGFDAERLLTFQLTVPPATALNQSSLIGYQDKLMQALQAIPGVTAAGFVSHLPLDGCCFNTHIYPAGATVDPRTSDSISLVVANSGYFRAMRIPLRGGRLLEDHDAREKPLPAIVNQAAARHYWPNRNPIGLSGHFGSPNGDPFQILGVLGDVKNNGLDNDTFPEIYLSPAVVGVNPLYFVVRSALPAKTLLPAVRSAIQHVNSTQPIDQVRLMRDIVRNSAALKRAAAYVMAFFAVAALLMATIGAYGVVSYTVRQRRVEMGTRMALGALPSDLLRLVVGSGMKMAASGIAIGGAASIAATWMLVRNFEIEVGNAGAGRIENPGILPFLFSALVVAVVAMGSSLFPAWWASLLSPMVAIRDQTGVRRARAWTTRTGSHIELATGIDASLVTELVEASRRAASYSEAILAALEVLRGSLGAQSVMLLETVAGGDFRTTAAVPAVGTACSIPSNGLLLNRLKSYSATLPVTVDDLETWHRWAKEYQPRHLPEIGLLEKTGVRLAVALRTNREVLGVLLMGAPVKGEQYAPSERRMLRGYADQFALLLENARLTKRVLDQEKLRRDLELAAEVQRRLLAQQSLENSAVSLAAFSIPARSVGGDYYDLLELGGDCTGIALADVAGKGVPAALIMSVVQATLRVLSAEPSICLSDLVAKMNHFLYRSTGPSSYATFFYAQIDQRERKLRYVNAGHNPPYVLRVDGASTVVEELPAGGTVIGMFPQACYEEGIVDLRPGDVLMVFTDGVPEALNPGDEEYGEERLKCVLRQVVSLPVGDMISRISAELKNWIQDAAQYDDLTCVLMKVK
jgi:predicted permease